MKRIRTVFHTVDRPRDILSTGVPVVALVTKPTGASFEAMTLTNYAVMSRFSMLHKDNKIFEFLLTGVAIFSQTVNLLVP